jgi:hypothetical protein
MVCTSLITLCPEISLPARRFPRLSINDTIALESAQLS